MKKNDSTSILILSIILAILVFIAAAFILRNMVPALILAVCCYAIAYFSLAKQKRPASPLEENSVSHIILKSRGNLDKLNSFKTLIKDEEARIKINSICDCFNKIIGYISQNPEKTTQVQTFLEYYIPVLINILEKYKSIESSGINTKEATEAIAKTKNMLYTIEEAFQKQHSSLYTNDITDLDASIRTFDAMLKSDGLYDEIKSDGKVDQL